MDFSLPSNRLIAGLTAAAAFTGVWLALTGGPSDAWTAPIHTFLVWAVVREIDPDHHATAIVAGAGAAGWVVAGFDSSAWLATGGFLLAARLVLNSTGRRPLGTDLVGLAIFATAISFTRLGWVAGFGLAMAIYVDDRMASAHRSVSVIAAALAGLGASGVATLSQAFPQSLPSIRPLLVVAVGVLAVLAVMREPERPTSVVDAFSREPLARARLHASRSLVGVLVFTGSALAGAEALALGPMVITLVLALASNELEAIRRGRR